MLGNDKRIESVSLSRSLFLSPPKKTGSEFLLVIYYASLGVVNCSSTWKRPFFSLAMIADQAWTYKQFWLGFFCSDWNGNKSNNKIGPCQNPLFHNGAAFTSVEKGNTGVVKGLGGGQLHLLNACINFNGQRMCSRPCLLNAPTGGAHTCVSYVSVAALHVCMCTYARGDKWLKSRWADGIAMTSTGNTLMPPAQVSHGTAHGSWSLGCRRKRPLANPISSRLT